LCHEVPIALEKGGGPRTAALGSTADREQQYMQSRMTKGNAMSKARPRRSVLYMPGSNARALEKAKTLAVDCLILDLEDAVAPEAKSEAREKVAQAVRDGGYGRREVIVRINGLDTEWGADDLAAAVPAGPDGLLVPKVSSASDVRNACAALDKAGAPKSMRLWAMMETPRAMLDALAIAEASAEPSSRLDCLVMGTNDLAKDTGAQLTEDRMSVLAWLSTCVAAAAAHGLTILDGVYNNFRDTDGFAAECKQGRVLGMDGKTLIHPNQIEVCNTTFSPDEAELERARKILEAFERPENAGKGVITVDGRMVERLHAESAAKIVVVADAIADIESE